MDILTSPDRLPVEVAERDGREFDFSFVFLDDLGGCGKRLVRYHAVMYLHQNESKADCNVEEEEKLTLAPGCRERELQCPEMAAEAQT